MIDILPHECVSLTVKEVELIVISALTHHNPPATSLEESNAIMLLFGLRLAPLPGSLIADIIAKSTKTTINYSRLFHNLYFRCMNNSFPFLELLEFKEDAISAFRIDEDAPNEVLQNICYSRHETIVQRLDLFRLNHSAEEITEMAFVMDLVAEYLDMRYRMSRLKSLIIITPYHMSDSNLQDVAQFIRDNQATFPSKARIHLRFEKPSWITTYALDINHHQDSIA